MRRLEFEELESRTLLSAALDGRILEISGTDGNDTIIVGLDGTNLTVNENGAVSTFAVADVKRIEINGGNGNDILTVNEAVNIMAVLKGGKGDDTLTGGSAGDLLQGLGGNDILIGGPGNDHITGNKGNDIILGAEGNDRLEGNKGSDQIDGGSGNDRISGDGSNDLLFGGPGVDTLIGGKGRDNFGPEDPFDNLIDFNADKDTQTPDNSFREPELLGVRTFELPGAPDIDAQATGFLHVAGVVDYSAYTNPPTYGPHHPAPLPTGVYTTVQADEDLVHNLEHGHVWISYQPANLSAADLAALTSLVESFGASSGIILTPRPADASLIALASWGHLLELSTFDAATIRQFILINRGHAHEGFATP